MALTTVGGAGTLTTFVSCRFNMDQLHNSEKKSTRWVHVGSRGSRNPLHKSIQQSAETSTTRRKQPAQQHINIKRHPLLVDRRTTTTAAARIDTTMTARLPHLLYYPNESGTRASIPRYDTVTNATVAVDTIDNLCLAQPNKDQ